MKLLAGKRGVIFGVANERSIAWAIAEAFHAEGAELAFTYAGEVLEKRVRPLAEGIGSKIILPCDVTKDEEIEKVWAGDMTVEEYLQGLQTTFDQEVAEGAVVPVPAR